MAGPILFANNADTTITSALGSGGTSVTLAAGTGALFPSPANGSYFVATLVSAANNITNEIVHVTARSGDTLTLVRAQEGTSALSWAIGDGFHNYLTAGSMQVFLQNANGYTPQLQEATFYTSGSWTAPFGVTRVKVRAWGGGGGATWADTGSNLTGLGGGGGGYAEGYIAVAPGTQYTVTVGSGGTGGRGESPSGVSGGGTSFAGVTANGGGGATAFSSSGAGGTAVNGQLNITGSPGAFGSVAGTTYIGGLGGASFGSSPYPSNSQGTAVNGYTGTFPGGGGTGGAYGGNGGPGANGLVLIEY